MYEIIVNICRYVFLAYMLLFLFSAFLICIGEKNILKINPKKHITFQRLLILLFNITAFSILAFNSVSNQIKLSIAPIFLIGTILSFLGSFIAIRLYKNSCKLLWNCIFFLTSISISMLYRLNSYLAFKQIIWIIVGMIVCFALPVVLNILPRLDFFKYIYLLLGLLLLLFTLAFGTEDGGAKNWITIKNITFQPSEIVKILFIFYLSVCFSKQNLKIRHIIFPTLVSMSFIFCLVLQTDLGSALIFFMIYLALVYISTSKLWIVIIGNVLALFGAFLSYKFFNHVKIRFDIWLNPWEDISNKGWQIAQSLFSIGTFGLLGSGLNLGMPTSIPVVERDLIFAAICEEFGVLFSIGLIIILIILFFRGIKISLNNNNKFLTLLSSGLSILLAFQSFLIIGGVIKFIPLTGVTLPFVSYGGSSMIISFAIIGILQWISIRNNKYEEKIEYIKCIEENFEETYLMEENNFENTEEDYH